MSIFKGSGVAIVTPFNDDGTIDFDSFKNLINFQIENGTDAIIVCGTTGEASTLTDDEQIECIKFTVDIVKKRIPVVAGAGSNFTEHAIELTKRSEQAGADAILSVTPYYNKTTQKGLIKHFEMVAGSVDIPIIVYSVQSRTGLNITPKTAYELCKIPNIKAIKEASGNISQVAEIAALCGDNIDIYSGNDDQNVAIMSLGGVGAISVLANIAPRDTHEMLMKFLEGDILESRKIQLKYMELIKALFLEVNPIPVKAALSIMGYIKDNYRMPLTKIEEENKKALISEMKNCGLV